VRTLIFFFFGKKDMPAFLILHSPVEKNRHLAPDGIGWYSIQSI